MNLLAHIRLRIIAAVSAAVALTLIALPQPVAKDAPASAAVQRLPIGPAVSGIAEMPTLFAGALAVSVATEQDSDLPALIGIAGRLPDDAEVLLRLPDGTTRSARIGESVEGWTLRSVAPDRAVFEQGGRQEVLVIAPLP